jgi:hypothetical protein
VYFHFRGRTIQANVATHTMPIPPYTIRHTHCLLVFMGSNVAEKPNTQYARTASRSTIVTIRIHTPF